MIDRVTGPKLRPSDMKEEKLVTNHDSRLQPSSNIKKWNISASDFAQNSINPIRQIVENLKVEPNPKKSFIPLSIGKTATVIDCKVSPLNLITGKSGDPTLFGNLCPSQNTIDSLIDSLKSGKHNGYLPSTGLDSAREAVAKYVSVNGAEIQAQV